MHDFHVFRQQQFDKCLSQGYFPAVGSLTPAWDTANRYSIFMANSLLDRANFSRERTTNN